MIGAFNLFSNINPQITMIISATAPKWGNVKLLRARGRKTFCCTNSANVFPLAAILSPGHPNVIRPEGSMAKRTDGGWAGNRLGEPGLLLVLVSPGQHGSCPNPVW